MERKLQIELAHRELASRDFASWVSYNFEGYLWNWHSVLLAKKLQEVADGTCKRLIVCMPPRRGKSELTSIQFPSWYIGKNPRESIMAASYGADLALDFGRQTRNIVNSSEFRNVFPLVRMAEDSQAKGKWTTNFNGNYFALGVGGSATGRGAKLLLIDDPIKNRQDADSVLVRDNVWSWYRSTARTRLAPDGAIVIICCMTGDTSVLMADGSEKQLRDIVVGDAVATWENGKLTTSTVLNWANHGKDKIFKITTKSGKILRANERHPFLINDNGTLVWRRVRNLCTANQIVTLKDSGGSGREKLVLQMAVSSQLSAEDIACHITRKRNGQTALVLRRLTQNQFVIHTLNIAIRLLLKSMRIYSHLKAECVQFVNKHLGIVPTTKISALTTVMTQEKLEPCCAIPATSQLVTQGTEKLLWPWQNISDFTVDEIISIEEDGEEDVFDIQIDRTENFIANGAVSHNTRWHNDDLVGRLLEGPTGNSWEIIKIKEIAEEDEPPYRKKGEVLWPARFSLESTLETKAELGSFEFSALYQQEPIDSENQEFKKDWFRYTALEDVLKQDTRCFITIDTALSQKESADYTAITVNFVNKENKWHILSERVKINSSELIDRLFVLYERYKPEKIGIEKTGYTDAIFPFLKDEMRKRRKVLPIVELHHHNTKKEIRIRGLVPLYENGRIYHIGEDCKDLEAELLTFPKGAHDDAADSLAYQLQLAEKVSDYSDDESSPSDSFDPHSIFG